MCVFKIKGVKMLKVAKFIAIASITIAAPLAHASMAIAIPQSTSGKVGQNINIASMYQYRIENNTSSFQNYVGFEELEVNGKKQQRPINFGLPAHGSKGSNGDMVSFGYTPTGTGTFKIRSSIKIMGMNGAAHNASADLKVTG